MGGLVATALGVLADARGLESVMWVIAALPVPAALLSLTLRRERPDKARSSLRGRFAAAGPG